MERLLYILVDVAITILCISPFIYAAYRDCKEKAEKERKKRIKRSIDVNGSSKF